MDFTPIVPFEPVSTDRVPAGGEWISQIKWDGVRMLVYYDGQHVELFNRKLNQRTMQYPELTAIRGYCSADSVILDGEVIALEDGKPAFHQVMRRDSVRKQSSMERVKNQVPVTYMIFDILYCNGRWLTENSLKERQLLLEKIIRPNETVQLVQNHPDAEALYKVAASHGLEGIVIKELSSKYAINGKDKRWQKKKAYRDLYAVAGGVTLRAGTVNALLLGLYDDHGQLWYIGHAGTGRLTHNDWRLITQTAKELSMAERPFRNIPERSQGAMWLRPQLTVKVQFMEWTPYRTLRQPSIQAFVSMSARECTFDQASE